MDGISIILPVYNAEKTIERCLDSLLCQTYENFEILAINDGSDDNSLQQLLNYAEKDSRIKVIDKHNEGVSATRNMGLKLAKRKWLTFCDADDEVLPGWLNTMAENMQNLDFVATGIHFIENDGTEYDKTLSLEHYSNNNHINDNHIGILINELITNNVFGFTWCKLFRRDIIEKYNVYFNTKVNFREDELWCVSYFEHIQSWITIPYIGYRYYLPTVKKSYKGDYTDFVLPIFEVYKRIFPTGLTTTIAKFYYRLIRNMLAQSISNGKCPSKRLTESFRCILLSYPEKRSFVSKLIDYMLANNNLFYIPAKILIRANQRL